MTQIKKHLREIILLFFIVVLMITASNVSPYFATASNLINILRTNSINGIIALGMTVLIISGNIDVAIGAEMITAGGLTIEMVVKRLPETGALNPVICLLFAMLVGILIGCANGFFTAVLHIPSIVVTLGTTSILRGFICLITRGQWLMGYPKWFSVLSARTIAGIPIGIIAWFLAAAITILYVNFSNAGLKLFATGGNKMAAERAGINCARVQIIAFAYLGALVGIASIFYCSQNGMVDPMAGTGYEMTIIAAAVLGGADINGGKASVPGTVLGVLLVGLIENVLVFVGVSMYAQKFITGLLIFAAVISTSYQNRRTRGTTGTPESVQTGGESL